MRTTEIYIIGPEKLTFECILDYFESRVIFLQSCVSFGREEYLRSIIFPHKMWAIHF